MRQEPERNFLLRVGNFCVMDSSWRSSGFLIQYSGKWLLESVQDRGSAFKGCCQSCDGHRETEHSLETELLHYGGHHNLYANENCEARENKLHISSVIIRAIKNNNISIVSSPTTAETRGPTDSFCLYTFYGHLF